MKPAKILCIDTSLDVCSVTVNPSGGQAAITLEEKGQNIHSARLNLMLEELMQQAELGFKDLDAICIDKGPGSYTGLRIGVSAAKGLCYALGKPLLAINTLSTMARFYMDKCNILNADNVLLCPMIDARRLEIYYAILDTDLDFVRDTRTGIVDEDFLKGLLVSNQIHFFGNGAAKCKPFLEGNNNAIFTKDEIHPSSGSMISTALRKFERSEFEDLMAFEPFYLKDFYIAANDK